MSLPVGSEVVRRFPGDVTAPADARRFVAETLAAWHHAELTDDATVVVSELATNAILHAHSGFLLTMHLDRHWVRFAVHDASTVVPSPRSPPPEVASGRGLRLVEAMSARWGTDVDADGKTVWAELAAT